jgi:hypothetical protein
MDIITFKTYCLGCRASVEAVYQGTRTIAGKAGKSPRRQRYGRCPRCGRPVTRIDGKPEDGKPDLANPDSTNPGTSERAGGQS